MPRANFLSFLFFMFGLGFYGCASPQSEPSTRETLLMTIPAVTPKRGKARKLATIPSEIGIWVNSSLEELGTYSVILEFDPQIIQLERIQGGEAPFDSMPFAKREDFLRGKVKIMAYHVEEKGPVGQTLVAKLFFRGLHPGKSPLKLFLEMATTPEGKRISHAKAFLSAQEVRVVVPELEED